MDPCKSLGILSRIPTICCRAPSSVWALRAHDMTDDPLINWRAEFPIVDTCTYLVSHSLGAMPRRTTRYLQEYAETWGTRGVRAWHEGWWEIGRTTGDLLAPLLGVPPGTISMHQNVTVAMSVIASCFTFDGIRRRVVMSDQEFPSNMYLFEGLRRYGAQVVYVPSSDPIAPDLEQLLDAIDERTVLVVLSAVLFRSSCIQDAAAVIERAHAVGAHVVLDVYQAAGTIPLEIGRLRADFAVGGSVKWLCGGPGAGYLYVRPDLAPMLTPAIIGWAAHADPFAFETGAAVLADPPERFQSGTPNVPSLYAARGGYEIVNEIGIEAIRARSLRLTRLIIERAEQSGYCLNTPIQDDRRGGAVIVDVPHGAAMCQALIARNVIVDFRPGAGIRLSPHFYNTEAEVHQAMDVLDELVGARVAGGDQT
jgi:kynureninase